MKTPVIAVLLSIIVSFHAVGAPPQLVPVQIHVRAAGGEAIREAYVALVPGWRPVHTPLAERILRDGRGEFRVPEDSYRVVAGARGYRVSVQGPFIFNAAAGGGKLDLTLEPLSEASGTVTDGDGNPLSGVRVEDTRAVSPPPLGGLSELAVRLLSHDWLTITDRQGSWKLRLPKGTVPMVFSAEARAAQFRIWKSNDPQPLDVTMPAGATLRVTADRADSGVMITLDRDGVAEEGGIPRDWQRQLWARWATTASLSWNSLPAGSYSIYAKYFDPAYFMQRAVKIGAATVYATGAANVKVKLPSTLRKVDKVVRLYVEGQTPEQLSGDDLEAYGAVQDGAPRRVPAVVQGTMGGSVIYINGDAAASAPFFAVTSTQFFSAAGTTDDSNAATATASVRDRADAHADLRSAEEGVDLPRGGTVVLRDCTSAKKRQGDTVSVPASIHGGHTAQFIGPANCASAVLSFAPFEPILLSKPLHPGDQSLGEFALHAAASADVHVVNGSDGSVPGAVVRVLTQQPDAPVVVSEVTTGESGWAHLATIPVLRNVRVVAQSPNGDPSDDRDVRAEPREKVIIDALRISSPATLIVAAKLKTSIRTAFPAAQVRMIFLRPSEMQPGESQRQERVRDENPVRFEHLKAGVWKLTAIVSIAGNDTLLDVDEIELKPGETRRVEKELEPLIFSSRVTIGGQGVAARVTLSNRSAISSVKPHFDSRTDGSFYAILPNPGTYRGAVAGLDAQQAEIPVGDIQFDDPSRPIEIALPALATVVVHVRAGGEAVPNVLVSTSMLSAPLDQVVSSVQLADTDAAGNARFTQLLPGQWVFAVREKSGRGGEKSLAVREGENADVTIELERVTTIEGTVRQVGGQPVPQARVACYSLGSTNLPTRSTAETNAEGGFSIDLPARPHGTPTCSVVTPSGEVNAFTATMDQPVVVQLSTVTARLQIIDWGKWGSRNPEVFWLAAPDGRAISLSEVAAVLQKPGTALLTAALAPGRWRVIRLQSMPQWIALVAGQSAMLPVAAEVTLRAGATESVSIDETNGSQTKGYEGKERR